MRRAVLIASILCSIKAEAQTKASAIADSLYATGNYNKAINYYAEAGGEISSLQSAMAYGI